MQANSRLNVPQTTVTEKTPRLKNKPDARKRSPFELLRLIASLSAPLFFGFVAYRLFTIIDSFEEIKAWDVCGKFLLNYLVPTLDVSDEEKIRTANSIVEFLTAFNFGVLSIFASYSIKAILSLICIINKNPRYTILMDFSSIALEAFPLSYFIFKWHTSFSFHAIYFLLIPHLVGMCMVSIRCMDSRHQKILMFLGFVEAVVISWKCNHSIWKIMFHAPWGWCYVAYEAHQAGGLLGLIARLKDL